MYPIHGESAVPGSDLMFDQALAVREPSLIRGDLAT